MFLPFPSDQVLDLAAQEIKGLIAAALTENPERLSTFQSIGFGPDAPPNLGLEFFPKDSVLAFWGFPTSKK